jgi:hypothetical protein
LSILGSGVFIWQVEAVSQAANGAIERRGTMGENRFTIGSSRHSRRLIERETTP